MPTYEFRCPDGHDFEKFYRTISGAESVAACPVCGKVSERRMSATGFAFKGSGFYLTDYGKNAHRTDSEGKSAAKPVTSSDAPSGSDAPKAESAKTESASGDSKAATPAAPAVKADAKAETKAKTPPPKSSSSE